jgi:preprotein translocase subunit SecG
MRLFESEFFKDAAKKKSMKRLTLFFALLTLILCTIYSVITNGEYTEELIYSLVGISVSSSGLNLEKKQNK